MSATPSISASQADPGAGNSVYFYEERARPGGVLCVVVGLVGVCATWIFVESWEARVFLTVLFGAFLAFGTPAVFHGGWYRCWFADGSIHWECPSRFYGDSGSCLIADVKEFQTVRGNDDLGYRFVMKNGEQQGIPTTCVGNVHQLIDALARENRSIWFSEVDG